MRLQVPAMLLTGKLPVPRYDVMWDKSKKDEDMALINKLNLGGINSLK